MAAVVNVNKQIGESDKLSKTKKYIDSVLDNYKNVNNLNKNDLYDLAYAKKLVEYELESEIDNDVVRTTFEEYLNKIDAIRKLITPKMVDSIVKNESLLDKQKVKHVDHVKGKSSKLLDISKLGIKKIGKRYASGSIKEAMVRNGFVAVIGLGISVFANDFSKTFIKSFTETVYNVVADPVWAGNSVEMSKSINSICNTWGPIIGAALGLLGLLMITSSIIRLMGCVITLVDPSIAQSEKFRHIFINIPIYSDYDVVGISEGYSDNYDRADTAQTIYSNSVKCYTELREALIHRKWFVNTFGDTKEAAEKKMKSFNKMNYLDKIDALAMADVIYNKEKDIYDLAFNIKAKMIKDELCKKADKQNAEKRAIAEKEEEQRLAKLAEEEKQRQIDEERQKLEHWKRDIVEEPVTFGEKLTIEDYNNLMNAELERLVRQGDFDFEAFKVRYYRGLRELKK